MKKLVILSAVTLIGAGSFATTEAEARSRRVNAGAVAAGVVGGFTAGLTLKHLGSTGGTDVIAALLRRRKPYIDLVWMIFGLNIVVAVLSYFVYGYRLEPVDGGTRVTQYYDWSQILPRYREMGIFPIISEASLKATLGILDRTVRRRARAR